MIYDDWRWLTAAENWWLLVWLLRRLTSLSDVRPWTSLASPVTSPLIDADIKKYQGKIHSSHYWRMRNNSNFLEYTHAVMWKMARNLVRLQATLSCMYTGTFEHKHRHARVSLYTEIVQPHEFSHVHYRVNSASGCFSFPKNTLYPVIQYKICFPKSSKVYSVRRIWHFRC